MRRRQLLCEFSRRDGTPLPVVSSLLVFCFESGFGERSLWATDGISGRRVQAALRVTARTSDMFPIPRLVSICLLLVNIFFFQ